jgi:hypothetical protein
MDIKKPITPVVQPSPEDIKKKAAILENNLFQAVKNRQTEQKPACPLTRSNTKML